MNQLQALKAIRDDLTMALQTMIDTIEVVEKAGTKTGIADPTDAEVEAVCKTMNFDFGLFGEALKEITRDDAREWFNAWRKEIEKRCHG